jgi:hypothetical protein
VPEWRITCYAEYNEILWRHICNIADVRNRKTCSTSGRIVCRMHVRGTQAARTRNVTTTDSCRVVGIVRLWTLGDSREVAIVTRCGATCHTLDEERDDSICRQYECSVWFFIWASTPCLEPPVLERQVIKGVKDTRKRISIYIPSGRSEL